MDNGRTIEPKNFGNKLAFDLIEKDQNSSVTCTTKTTTTTTTTTTSANKTPVDYSSYVVLVAAFIAYMLAALLSSCFGVFFDSMATDLALPKSKVAFIGACLSSLDNLLGPISSAFINRYGCRKTCITGGLFSACGIIASSHLNEFWLIGLFMGIVSGFGTSLVLVSCVVIVTYYFEDKPSFASGFVISGGSFGQSIFSLIIIKLNECYGRSGCFLIIGGLLLNIVVCGLLFRQCDHDYNDEDDEYDDVDEQAVLDDFELDSDETSVEKPDDMFLHHMNDLPFMFHDLNAYDKFSYKDYSTVLDVCSCVAVDATHQSAQNSSFIGRLRRFFQIKKTSCGEKVHHLHLQRKPVVVGCHHGRSHSISTPLTIHPVDSPTTLPTFTNTYLRYFYYKSLVNLNTRLVADTSPLWQSKTKPARDRQQQQRNDSSHNQLSMSCPSLMFMSITTSTKTDSITVNDLNYRLNKYRHIMERNSKLTDKTVHNKSNINDQGQNEKTQQDTGELMNTNVFIGFASTANKFVRRLFNSVVQTLKLFGIFEFAIFALCNFILSLFYEAPFYFINSYMIENGFTQSKAGLVTVAIGVACIFASIAYGYLGDLKRLNWIVVYSLSLMANGLCNFIIPYCVQNYMLTMLTMVCIGVFISVQDVLVPIICLNTVGCDDFVSAYGLILFCQGISSLIGPPILGMIVDYAESYAFSYNICGIGMCLSGIILLTILVRKQFIKKSDHQDEHIDMANEDQQSKADSKLETIIEVRKETDNR